MSWWQLGAVLPSLAIGGWIGWSARSLKATLDERTRDRDREAWDRRQRALRAMTPRGPRT